MTLYVPTQRLYGFQHLIGCALLGRFKSKSIDDMADSAQTFVLVPRPGIDIDANSGEWPGKRFSCYS